MAERRGEEADTLELLIDAGVVDRKATLADLMQLSAKLEESSGGGPIDITAWTFIVKNKFIFKDDEKTDAVK